MTELLLLMLLSCHFPWWREGENESFGYISKGSTIESHKWYLSNYLVETMCRCV